jgi:hypothetical protein
MSAACLLCFVPAAPSSRLCHSHSNMWIASPERRRAMEGPGDEHAVSMFSDFVARMHAELDIGSGGRWGSPMVKP